MEPARNLRRRATMTMRISLCIAATVALVAGCASSDMFRRLDANGDGFVSRQEAMLNDNVARSFDAADRNGDGKLDRQEFNTLPAY